MKDAKADAALYLLTGLLQRIESQQPGLIDEMKQGVLADQKAIDPNVENYAHIEQIFNESLTLLERISVLSKHGQ